jgi:MYXO-CTERM domain-containing protein
MADNANSSQNPTVSATFNASTVTTLAPASVAKLGLGLAGVGGLALRRRMTK